MFDPDAANPGSPADDAQSDSERHLRVEGAPDKLDVAGLVEKFTVHGGGRVSAQVSADLALDLVLNQIAEQTCLATPASGAAIVLERGGEWVCRASAGGNSPILGARLDAEAGLSGECIKTRQIQRCDDAQSDPRADIEACRSLGIRSVLILPLLQDDQVVGVFEAFSSQPAAFGKRDENTLEVLCQRVLANLKQTSQTLSSSTESSSPNPAEASDETPGNPVVENSSTEIPIFENAIEDKTASEHASKHTLNAALENATIPEAANESASMSGINIATWILGAAVLAFALLLTVVLAVRFSRGRSGSRAHPRTDVSAKLSDAEHTPAPGASDADATKTDATKTKEKETRTNSAAKNRSGFAGSPSTSESRGTAVATLPHPTSTPQAGGLQVFEKGKEIFRMPPAPEQSQLAAEPAAIYELPPEAASQSLVHRVEPEYPQEALQQHIQGPVALEVGIGRDGTVQTVKLISGQPLLAEAAMAAVKQWKFKPHLTKGQAVEMQTKVILNFRLPG
jgi:TonB family protein